MIFIDSREKENLHIRDYFDSIGHLYSPPVALKYGDYATERTSPKIVVERKKSWLELSGNLGKHHERFRNELLRARDCEAKVIVLVEETTPIWEWTSKRTKMTGCQMKKIMDTMSAKYPVEWAQCEPYESGEKIIEILGEDK